MDIAWDPKVVLGIINPEGLSFTCMATKAGSDARCCKPLSQDKKNAILDALKGILATEPADGKIDTTALHTVAENAFCYIHNSDPRNISAVVQWKHTLAAARAFHAGIRHLASAGVSDIARPISGGARSVGGSDTDSASGSDNDSSDDDSSDDDSPDDDSPDDDSPDDDDDDDSKSGAESKTVSTASGSANRTAPSDASDAEIEKLRQRLERYRLENRTLRSQLEATTRSKGRGEGRRSKRDA